MSLHDHHRIQERLKSVADPVAFLVSLFAHAPVGFAVWSIDGRPLLTNKAFMDIFLVEPPPEYNVLKDELLAANGMLPLFQRAFRGETVHVPTFWYDPREHTSFPVTEGRRVAVSMTIFPLFRAGGEVDYVAATYKDETEIMQANERLRRGEEDLRITLDSIGDAVIATDASGAVTRMNPVAEDLPGGAHHAGCGASRGTASVASE
jgi:PAS domain-containing protein